MTTLLEKIEREARKLSRQDRERLAANLMAGVDRSPLSEIDQAWIDEAESRYEAWKAGRARAVPTARALAEMRKKLRR